MSSTSGIDLTNEKLYTSPSTISWTSPVTGAEEKHDIGNWHAFQLPKAEAIDWVDELELDGALGFSPPLPEGAPTHKPRILVLYGKRNPSRTNPKRMHLEPETPIPQGIKVPNRKKRQQPDPQVSPKMKP